MVHWVAVLEWSGSLCGLTGAFLLATHTRLSRYGWVAFFVANIAMVGFALGIGRYGLLVQQLGFMATMPARHVPGRLHPCLSPISPLSTFSGLILRRAWAMRQEWQTPDYMARWADIPTALA